MKLTHPLLALVLGFPATQALACFTVYDRSGLIVYNASTPPVDMSRPLHETLPARFPGGHLVFDTQTDCTALVPAPAPVARGGSPLLTDRRTARSMNVPYTVVQGDIVMVRPRDTRGGQAGSIVPDGSGAAAAPGAGTVITELRNPPVTIVESGDGVAITELSRK